MFLHFLAWVLVQLECLCDLWPTCFFSYTSMLQLTSHGYDVTINPSKSFYWTYVHLIEEKHIPMKLQRELHENNFKQTLQWVQWLNFWVSDHHLHRKDHWWVAMTFLSTKFTNLRDSKSFIKLMNHCNWIIQLATSYAQAWAQHWFHHIQNLPLRLQKLLLGANCSQATKRWWNHK